ncbi:MAG TPA: PAS domain S-box protein [Opitutaceae bacterium]
MSQSSSVPASGSPPPVAPPDAVSDERASLQRDLERRIAERTAELESAKIALAVETAARRGAQAALESSELSLRLSEDLFAKSFHGSPALMSIARYPEGQLIEANPAFLRAAGFTKAEVLGRTTLELGLWAHPAQRDAFVQMLGAQQQVRDFEAEFHSRQGRPHMLLLNADRIEIGGQPCILNVAVDITERRLREEAEAALARAEARYRSIFENAVEGLYMSSIDGCFLSVNPALARLCGFDSPAEMMHAINDIGEQLYVDPHRRGEFFKLIEHGDVVTDFISEIRRRDGQVLWISESVRAVRRADGTLDHLEGVAIDVTAEHEAERALRAAKEAADEANRAKSHFLASMSHELRTPLNGILGYTQILRRDSALTGRQRQGLDVIHASAEHLLTLINDVLDLSKIEARRLELNLCGFDLPGFVRGVADVFLPRTREKGIGFATEFASDLPLAVRGDEQRLRQTLFNLVGNAVKFTVHGGIIFSVQPGAVPGTVRFSVSDTGPGIASAELPTLFAPFTQVGDARLQAGGTGLGLAISRSLVELMGGRLEVESRPGWGSRFWFDLPLPAVSSDTARPRRGPRRVVGYEGPTRAVLVVDDHPSNRAVLCELLRSAGFAVRDVDTGEAALAACAATWPDLVLMDLRMPGMDGLETTRRLRTLAPPTLRIAAVSASAYDLDRHECFAAGCDDFLAKPVREEELWDVLERLLGLVWHFSSETSSGTETSAPFPMPSEPPPAADAEAIYQLASNGDVAGLRAHAEAMLARSPEHAEFARAVLDLTTRFRMKAIRQLVLPWRPPGPSA